MYRVVDDVRCRLITTHNVSEIVDPGYVSQLCTGEINGLKGIWNYAKERLIKHHGVSKEKFPFYLKEMEFRYNNRNTTIFTQLVKYLVNLVPDLL